MKYAETYGANGYRVTSASELPEILKTCLDTPGVNLIDCAVDYSDNDLILNTSDQGTERRGLRPPPDARSSSGPGVHELAEVEQTPPDGGQCSGTRIWPR